VAASTVTKLPSVSAAKTTVTTAGSKAIVVPTPAAAAQTKTTTRYVPPQTVAAQIATSQSAEQRTPNRLPAPRFCIQKGTMSGWERRKRQQQRPLPPSRLRPQHSMSPLSPQQRLAPQPLPLPRQARMR
jgi:hypothetical protein